MTVTITDPETIRRELVDQIKRIIPTEPRQRDSRWTWLEDQEIRGTIRNFDVLLEPEVETTGGGYGGGLQYEAATNIMVSYDVSEADQRRLVGADGRDLAAMLVRVHESVPGMFPVVGYDRKPIAEITVAGKAGAYTVTFSTQVSFWASDLVNQEVA